MNRQIGYRHHGQIQLQTLPVITVIERNIDTRLCPCEQQAFLYRVLPDRAHEGIVRDPCNGERPGFAVIMRAINVGSKIVHLIAVYRGVGRGCIVRRGFDHVYSRPRLNLRRRHIGPGLSAIARYVDQAVIRTCPDPVFVER